MIIKEEFLTIEKFNLIKKIMTFREYTNGSLSFGGSLALYLSGNLERRIGDIDLCTHSDEERSVLVSNYGIGKYQSQNSNINNVRHFGLFTDNINFCLFQRPWIDYLPIFYQLTYNDENLCIRCQDIKQIVEAKEVYRKLKVKKHILDEERFALSNI